MARVRTNIEIEETYVEEIMRRFHLRTKTEAVNFALEQLAAEPWTTEQLLAMEGYFKNHPFERPAKRPPRGLQLEDPR